MKKLVWFGVCITSLLISACGGSVEPTASAEDVQTTAVVAAFTLIAETHAIIPTDTSIPPTDTLAPTLAISDTPIPSPTITIVPTFTSQPTASSSSADPCKQTLSAWEGPSATFDFIYEYSPQGKDDRVVISMWVKTAQGECGFLADPSTGPVGQYSAAAYIDGEKDFKVFGGFRISESKWDIVIRNDTIVALGSCYPNC